MPATLDQQAGAAPQATPVPAAPTPPAPPTPPPNTIIFDRNGPGDAKISIGTEGIQVIKDGQTVQVPMSKVIPQGVIDITLGFFVMVVAVVIGGPLARAWARRLDRRAVAPQVPAEVTQRLAAIEQAVEAVAVEVERISEGQRFTARLLAERTPEHAQRPDR